MKDTVNKLAKGIYLDISPHEQPDGTYRFALNAVNEGLKGHQSSIGNEPANELCVDLGTSHLIGSIEIEPDYTVLFLLDEDGNSYISYLDGECTVTTLVKATCLNFNFSNRVSGTFKIRNGCEKVVYFTDNLNPPKAVNLDDLLQYLPDGTSVSDANAEDSWDCTLFNLFPDCVHPCIEFERTLDRGGSLEYGVYFFAVQYLDAEENGTTFFPISKGIPIARGNYEGFSDYRSVGGGENSIHTIPSSKSIQLSISEIDQTFSFLRIAVVRAVSGLGLYSDAYLIDTLPITNSTLSYTFRGIDTDEDVPISVEEVVIPATVYTAAKSIIQKNNRLLLANLKEEFLDLSDFQQRANQITVNYVTQLVNGSSLLQEKNLIDTKASPKTGRYYFDRHSYMRDEVYDFAIVWMLTDKTETPAFHIPGRSLNTGSTLLPGTLINNGDYNQAGEFGYLGIGEHNRPPAVGGWDSGLIDKTVYPEDTAHLTSILSPQRWQVYNTAIMTEVATDPVNDGYRSKGEMSYWESELQYPDDIDCDGNRIYPEGNIRYHKFPDATLEAIHFGPEEFSDEIDRISVLGIEFNNISPPAKYADKVQGFRIVRRRRDNSNSSVLDKGLAYRAREEQVTVLPDSGGTGELQNYITQSYPYGADRNLFTDGAPVGYTLGTLQNFSGNRRDDLLQLHFPKAKFTKETINVDFIKLEREIGGTVTVNTSTTKNHRSSCVYDQSNVRSNTATNRTVTEKAYINFNSVLSNAFFGLDVANTLQQEVFMIELQDDCPDILTFIDDSYLEIDGGTSAAYFYSLKRILPDQYGDLYNKEYITTHTCLFDSTDTQVKVFGGDTFVHELNLRRTATGRDNTGDRCKDRHLITFFTESIINSELRYEGDITSSESCEVYYPESFGPNYDKVDYLEYEDNFSPPADDDYICPNFYGYNADYHMEETNKIFFSISINYDYCNDCVKEYPYRLAYSEQSLKQEKVDNFRVFLSNNYTDLSANRGKITNMFVKQDRLYVHTERALWFVFASETQVKTSDATVFLGTGDFLSNPPKEIESTYEEYLGSTSQWATHVSEFGAFFVEEKAGRVFLFSDKINEISTIGLHNWFKEKLPLQWNKNFKRLTGLDWASSDAPQDYRSTGIHVAYDSRLKRYLLTKRDYRFLDEVWTFRGVRDIVTTYNKDDVVWNTGANAFQQYQEEEPGVFQWIDINYWDIRFFENLGFTLSYSCIFNSWTSWHSYIPTFYLDVTNRLYSYNSRRSSDEFGIILHDIPDDIDSDAIYEHNLETVNKARNFCKYYGTSYKHIIEIVAFQNPLITKITDSISWLTEALIWKPFIKQWINENNTTFNEALIYNDYQSTGKLKLIVKGNFIADLLQRASTDILGEALIDRDERTWNLNDYKDVVNNTTESLFTSDWVDDNYKAEFYIDKIPNENVLDTSKNWYNRQDFRDKYIILRLFFDNNETKLVTSYVTTSRTISP